jgi:hypothetical protein
MYHNAGLVQGVPDHEPVIAPVCTKLYSYIYCQSDSSSQENQNNGPFGHPPQGVVPGPIQAGFAGPSTQRTHPYGQPTVENLRRLASRYVHHPGSQVDMVRMEPGTAGRYQVVIVLEMVDLL